MGHYPLADVEGRPPGWALSHSEVHRCQLEESGSERGDRTLRVARSQVSKWVSDSKESVGPKGPQHFRTEFLLPLDLRPL